MSSLGKTIQNARLRKGLSLREFARQIDVGVSAAFRFESGEYRPKDEVMNRIAEVLEMDVEALHRLTGRLRPSDIEYLKRKPAAALLLQKMTDADTQVQDIKKMMRMVKP